MIFKNILECLTLWIEIKKKNTNKNPQKISAEPDQLRKGREDGWREAIGHVQAQPELRSGSSGPLRPFLNGLYKSNQIWLKKKSFSVWLKNSQTSWKLKFGPRKQF